MQIEHHDLASLRPYPRNARRHSKRQIEQIAESIRRFGFTNPVLVSDAGEIIAGHGRVAAAKLLGMKTVPTVKLAHLSEAERRAYVLADNKLALNAGWDHDVLAIELQALIDLDFNLEVTGFEVAEIDFALGPRRPRPKAVAQHRKAEDAVPELADAAISRAGDLWMLGRHRLLCGDARSSQAYGRLLGRDLADMVFTQLREDPSRAGRAPPELGGALSQLAQASHIGARAYVSVGWRDLSQALCAGQAAFGQLEDLCVWTGAASEPDGVYRAEHELVLVFGEPPLGAQRGRAKRGNVWRHEGVANGRHARRRAPVALIADALKDGSPPGGVVIDGFGGFGDVLIAAETCGRSARLLEADPRLCDAAIRRFEAFAREPARLGDDAETFATTAAARGRC